MPKLGPLELIIILVIVIVIFGAGRIASMGGALGKSISEFRKARREGDVVEPAEKPAQPAQSAQQTPQKPTETLKS